MPTHEMDEMEEACRFYGSILLHPRTLRCIDLTIDVDPEMDVQGECLAESEGRRPKEFTIKLRRHEDDDDPFSILAHEMVHLNQITRGHLSRHVVARVVDGSMRLNVESSWMGETWVPGPKEHPYFDSPWELEAYAREVELFYRWRNRDGS